ncbi:MAG: four helix bundle protein [Thermoplasmata archaeon]|nr:MAG: four helix bundle protein [Thermoplasmata archaeon]
MTGTYKNLDAWKKSIQLAKRIYQVSESFPDNHPSGLKSQIRRSAVSISNNIAEGSGLSKEGRKLYHFDIAFGSCNEVDNLSTLALEIGYINEEVQKEIEEIIISIRRPLSGLIKYTENKIQNFKT